MIKRKNAYTEVYTILQDLDEEEYELNNLGKIDIKNFEKI